MKKHLLRSADVEDNMPYLPSLPIPAFRSPTGLPVPPNMPIIIIVMRWKIKIELGLQAAWRPLFIHQVCTKILTSHMPKLTLQIVPQRNPNPEQENIVVY